MDTVDEINKLIGKYDFPASVLIDVDYRLSCSDSENYVKQQLRYLHNLVRAGIASKKISEVV